MTVLRRLDWKEKGVKISGERISHLRFTNDVILKPETETMPSVVNIKQKRFIKNANGKS